LVAVRPARLHKSRRSSSIVFVANVSVAEAARRLGVSVSRIHQRIADGSLNAERIGSQWVVDELSLLRVAERRTSGRPLSARSAWALIATAEGDQEALTELAGPERARAGTRLEKLLALAAVAPQREADVRRIASELRSLLGKRAFRELRKAAGADLADVRQDSRWQSLVSSAASGIAMLDVDGYLAASDLKSLTDDFLLMPAGRDANVAIHVLPEGQKAYPQSRLLLAADLADRRGPREEARAAELLHEIAEARQETRK
jgi:excisionase family DNA binding protein